LIFIKLETYLLTHLIKSTNSKLMKQDSNLIHTNEAIEHPDNDLFNFYPYVLKVQESIRNTGTIDEPIVYGVLGKWGEGKSSFMNLLFKNLESNTSENSKSIIKYKFNPWRYQSEDKLLVNFFSGLTKVINSDYSDDSKSSLIEKLKKYTSAILSGTSVEVENGFNFGWKSTVKTTYKFKDTLDKLEENKDVETLKDEIDEILESHKFRIVIFLDDIDRLNKEELYLIFRLLKLIASFKNLTYIVALDDEMVAKAIYKKYGDDITDGKNYLEKIINIPLTLPKIEPFDIKEELTKGLKLIFSQNKIDITEISTGAVHNYNSGTNRFFTEIDGAEKLIETPRVLYRLLNSFSINITALVQEVNYADLFWLEFLKLRYFKVYNYVKNNPGEFIRHGTFDAMFSDPEKLINEELFEFFESDTDLKKNSGKIQQILERLFPLPKRKLETINAFLTELDESYNVKEDNGLSEVERRINHSEFFKIYFNFHTKGRVSNLEIEELLRLIYSQGSQVYNEFKTFISKNHKGKFRYEIINRLKQLEDKEKRQLLIEFLLRHIDDLTDDEKDKDIFNKTVRNQLIEDVFKNLSVLESGVIDNVLEQFSPKLSIADILFARKGLYNDKFENTEKQKYIDTELIDKVKIEFKTKPFFDTYDNHIVRSIFSIWNNLNHDEFEKYVKSHLNKDSIISFIKCFPTIWSDSNKEEYLDNFLDRYYQFLKGLINPEIVAEVIEENFSKDLQQEKYDEKHLFSRGKGRDDLHLLAEFMYQYKLNRDNINNDLKI